MEFKKAVNLRQSVREFDGKQISDDQLNAILDAAYQAPTAMAKFERMHLIVVQNEEVLSALRKEFEKTSPPGAAGDPTYGAPTLIYVCEKAEDEVLLAAANTGVMMENLLLAAASEGLGSCYLMGAVMANRGNAEVSKLIGLPEGYLPYAAAAIGYPKTAIAERPVDKSKYETSFIK